MLPTSIANHFKEAFNSEVKSHNRTFGGSINQAAQVQLVDGSRFFVKWNRPALGDIFKKEKEGLDILAQADTDLVIPQVHDLQTNSGLDVSFIVLDYIEPCEPNNDFFEQFGRAVAQLHSHSSHMFGLDHDNFIGKLPQDNSQSANWIEFFVECRLRPQFETALNDGLLQSSMISHFERLLDQLEELLPEEPPSLLHGDLWDGNYLATTDNRVCIFDPAVYYGNREIELAFTRLFGGFDDRFYDGYNEVWPLENGFEKRIDIYNLYPLLVHVNLFGRAYADQVRALLSTF